MSGATLSIGITGIGVLACNGLGREAFWDSLEHGRSGIGLVDRFDTSDLSSKIGGQLWNFDAAKFVSKADYKRWHRSTHQAVVAAQFALEDAGFDHASCDPERVAVGIGSSISSRDDEYDRDRAHADSPDWQTIDKFASSTSSAHASTASITSKYGFQGPAITIGSACATGLDCMTWGVNQIRSGLADTAIVGATETPMTKAVFKGSIAMGILSKCNDDPSRAMRPFCKSADGIVMSESAVVIVLERVADAKRRGAQIFAEVAGSHSTSEGGNPFIVQRNGDAVARAVSGALRSAGMNVRDLDSIQSHGVGLSMYDKAEVAAYKTALGDHAYRVPISSVKSMTGQPYSVGGLLGIASGCMSLTTGIVAPTINLDEPAENCDLDFVPNEARLNAPNNVLISAMSFGGTHGSIVLRKVA